ncbi:MAG: hypothetical protein AAFR61_07890 [Bacteroidota bacterium]
MKRFFMMLVAGCFFLGACTETSLTSAKVLNEGDPARDGCGWIILDEATDTRYSPVNLDSTYMINNLEVALLFSLTGNKAPVCWGQLDEIDIQEIKEK